MTPTNVCECCWKLGNTYQVEKGYVCSECIEKLKKLKEVDNNDE